MEDFVVWPELGVDIDARHAFLPYTSLGQNLLSPLGCPEYPQQTSSNQALARSLSTLPKHRGYLWEMSQGQGRAEDHQMTNAHVAFDAEQTYGCDTFHSEG